MISPTPERNTGPLNLALLVVMAALLLLAAFQQQHWDSDIFWALKSGEWITHNLSVPKTDPFSYTFAAEPWVDFTWGFQVLAHLFFTYLGGWSGLFVLQVMITAVTFLVIFRCLRDAAPQTPWIVAALLVLVFAASYKRIFIRPHLFGYLLISVYILLLNTYERNGRHRFLWALPLLQILWVNIHSSAILGVFITGAYAGGAVMDELRAEGFSFRRKLSRRTKHMIAAAVAVPAASVINPYGVLLSIFPFIHQNADNSDALRHIGEWTKVPLGELFFNLYPEPITYFAFRVLVIASVAALLLNFRRIKTRDVIILCGALYMAVSHIRWLAIFGYFTVPLIAANISLFLADNPWRRKTAVRAAACLAVFVLAFVAWDFGSRSARAHYGLGEEHGAYPQGTVEFINREGIAGNIYNEYIFGGYLIYHTSAVRPFIDGRTPTVYSPYHFWTFRLVNDPDMWARLVKEHSLDMALIRPEGQHCVDLWNDGSWHAVSIDDISVLFVKDTTGFAPLIERFGMKNTPPCYRAKKYEMPAARGSLELMRGELANLVRTQPVDSAVSHWLLGRASTSLADAVSAEGSPDPDAAEAEAKAYYLEAIREFEAAQRVRDDQYINYDLGVVYGRMDRAAEAAEAYDRAISFDSDFKDAYLGAGLALFDAGDYDGAVLRLGEYVKMADDTSTHDAYKTLGIACFETGDLGCAEAYLKRSAFLAGDDAEVADDNFRLGNVYLEMGRIDAAAARYMKSIETSPVFAGSLKVLADDLERSGNRMKSEAVYGILSTIESGQGH